MDLYVRNYQSGGTHDAFYTDRTIINAFKNYVSLVVQRYANEPAVLGWELGSDLRCSSTVPASSSCNTTTITNWVAEICERFVPRFLLSWDQPNPYSELHQVPWFSSPCNCRVGSPVPWLPTRNLTSLQRWRILLLGQLLSEVVC